MRLLLVLSLSLSMATIACVDALQSPFRKNVDVFFSVHHHQSQQSSRQLMLQHQGSAASLKSSRAGGAGARAGDGPLINLQESLEKARIEAGVHGTSIAILHKNKLIFAEGFGKRNDYEPFTAETVAPIGSVSKSFTVGAIGELVAEGKLDWDTTPVNKYLPEFEMEDPLLTSQLTFQDLLSHRTGMPRGDLLWFWRNKPTRELIKHIKHFKVSPKLKAEMVYNNAMYAVSGEAAANVAGISYKELVESKILRPLGLNRTGVSMEEMRKLFPDNYAQPYDAKSFEDAQEGRFVKLAMDNMAQACAPAGDLYSNVLDLVQWGNAVMRYGQNSDGSQVLNKESILNALTAHSIANTKRRTSDFPPSLSYGLGWALDAYKGNVMYHHGGNLAGHVANLALFPDSELVIAQLANVDSTSFPQFAVYYIADRVLGMSKSLDWLELNVNITRAMYEAKTKMKKGNFPDRVKDKSATHKLDAYVGTYTQPYYGDIMIRLQQQEVWSKDNESQEDPLSTAPTTKRLTFQYAEVFEGQLDHYHYNSFSTALKHSFVNSAVLVTFSTGMDGSINSLFIDLGEGDLEFKRAK